MLRYLFLIFLAASAFGQFEMGATVGYGIYHDGTLFSSVGTADAGIRNRFSAGILIGEDITEYISGEFNYLYHDGHPFLQAGGVKTDIQGNSDALTMDCCSTSSRANAVGAPFWQEVRVQRNM
jgi:hypothetical protein